MKNVFIIEAKLRFVSSSYTWPFIIKVNMNTAFTLFTNRNLLVTWHKNILYFAGNKYAGQDC